MIILIPLGGTGQRFKKNNYSNPKALVNIFGKPILYYLLDNLEICKEDLIYIPYNKEYTDYRFSDRLIKDYPHYNFKFLELEINTLGAAHTINIALEKLINSNNCNGDKKNACIISNESLDRIDIQVDCKLEDQGIICLDSDNFYTIDILSLWDKQSNAIITTENYNSNPIYSYIKKKENNKITDIIEKEKISDVICTGGYCFRSYIELFEHTKYILENKIQNKEEYYTSTVIKNMLDNKIEFNNIQIESSLWHCLGTPIQLKMFYNNYPKIDSISKKNNMNALRFCFDLDNTLVTFPKIKNDYTSVKPVKKNIDFLRYIKSFGHTIIIYTARRMKTHQGNTGSILRDIGKITFDTLDKFNIPYDEIYFGKPNAHFYIDDLAINCFNNLEKETGFYLENIQPREFNDIEKDTISIFTKKSTDLSGEIFYYNNIPKNIKDLFPLLIDYDYQNFKWYSMEKINGITLTNLYLSELLTVETLESIIQSLDRIHKSSNIKFVNKLKNKKKINIYDNYVNKLTTRFDNYDYTMYPDSKEIYNNLKKSLAHYETQKSGITSIIHGDPVMTNIIINNYGKIKFIDMRGKIGSKLSLYGDELYDWAKLYQSLIGYDEILQDKSINEDYKNKMIHCFLEKLSQIIGKEKIKYVKLITQSLLFTLIPLHNNEKCIKYFELINKI